MTAPAEALRFCDFVSASPTPFHAVANLCDTLLQAGFTKLSERDLDIAQVQEGGQYFYTRNQSSLVAFSIPRTFSSDTRGYFIAGHLDSCCPKLRPISNKEKHGYITVKTELYGNGVWPTWFDRDLSLAGRVIISEPGASQQKQFVSKLVQIRRPILRIPMLAIHLDQSLSNSLSFNKEDHLVPITGLAAEPLSGQPHRSNLKDTSPGSQRFEKVMNHSLISALAKEIGCNVDDIVDFELSLFDVQKSCVGGVDNELLFSPRIDNLMTCFCSIEALCADPVDQTDVHCVILFDNEEVGSLSNHGAKSNLLPAFVELIATHPNCKNSASKMLATSFLVSGDMSHAIHPNYPRKHEENHSPRLNGGVVIKSNAEQRYATNAQGSLIVRMIADKAGIPVQEYQVRNDCPCGSTIGPIVSAHTRVVDVGLAQLSMHSIRETSGSADVKWYIDFFGACFKEIGGVDRRLKVD